MKDSMLKKILPAAEMSRQDVEKFTTTCPECSRPTEPKARKVCHSREDYMNYSCHCGHEFQQIITNFND